MFRSTFGFQWITKVLTVREFSFLLGMLTHNVLVNMETKTHDDVLETMSQTPSVVRTLLSPFLCVLRGILGRDFGIHQALSEEHGAGVYGRLWSR